MKLSKNNLKTLLRHSAWDDLAKACEDDTLEIEGYERVQWTRFDPNDPTTFPKEGELCYGWDNRDGGKIFPITFTGRLYFCANYVKYWRPLPKPPVESEA